MKSIRIVLVILSACLNLQAMSGARTAFSHAKKLITPPTVVHWGLFLGPCAAEYYAARKEQALKTQKYHDLTNATINVTNYIQQLLKSQGVPNWNSVSVKMQRSQEDTKLCKSFKSGNNSFIILEQTIDPLTGALTSPLEQAVTQSSHNQDDIFSQDILTTQELKALVYDICLEAQHLKNNSDQKALTSRLSAPLTIQALLFALNGTISSKAFSTLLAYPTMASAFGNALAKGFLSDLLRCHWSRSHELHNEKSVEASNDILAAGFLGLLHQYTEHKKAIEHKLIDLKDQLERDTQNKPEDTEKTLNILKTVIDPDTYNFLDMHACITDRTKQVAQRIILADKQNNKK